jgi:hypothetical protein
MWSWGRRRSGEGGILNLISTSSPVQVGSATNWSSNNRVFAGAATSGSYLSTGFAMGIKNLTTSNPTI